MVKHEDIVLFGKSSSIGENGDCLMVHTYEVLVQFYQANTLLCARSEIKRLDLPYILVYCSRVGFNVMGSGDGVVVQSRSSTEPKWQTVLVALLRGVPPQVQF